MSPTRPGRPCHPWRPRLTGLAAAIAAVASVATSPAALGLSPPAPPRFVDRPLADIPIADIPSAGTRSPALPGAGLSGAGSPVGYLPAAEIPIPGLRLVQADDATPLRPGATRPIRPEAGSLAYPRRKVGLWEIRSNAGDQSGLPPARFCVGENTDNPAIQLDRAAGEKGSCSIGPFRRVGTNWTAETVCRDTRQTVISQSVAAGDFLTEYRIDTLVFYTPPLPGGKREDRESISGRYLGACKAGQRAGDLELPGMGTLNMNDGTVKP